MSNITEVVTYQDDAIKLRKAIGCMVPTLLNVLLNVLPADAESDREATKKVLERVNAALEDTKHLEPLYFTTSLVP